MTDDNSTSEVSVEAKSAFDNVEIKSAFDKENFNEVTLIMLMRVYDLQLALLSALDPEKAAALVEMHAQGQSFCPPPTFAEYDDDGQE